MEGLSEFSSGENKQSVLYYYALYYFVNDNNYSLSMDYCIKGLQIEDPAITLENPIGKIYSNIGICLMNCLSVNLEQKNEIQASMNIYLKILAIIEEKIFPNMTYYQSNEFEMKMYQVICYNISLRHCHTKDYDNAVIYVNKGINFSMKYHYIYHLSDLLNLKYEILYKLDKFEEARHIYDMYYNLHLLENNLEKDTEELKKLHTDFNRLLAIDPYKQS